MHGLQALSACLPESATRSLVSVLNTCHLLCCQDTALHLAARLGHMDCVKELLQNGATQDLCNMSGETAYVAALLMGRKHVAVYLKVRCGGAYLGSAAWLLT